MQVPDPDALRSAKAVGPCGIQSGPKGIRDEQTVDNADAFFPGTRGNGIKFVDEKLDVLSRVVCADQRIIIVDSL